MTVHLHLSSFLTNLRVYLGLEPRHDDQIYKIVVQASDEIKLEDDRRRADAESGLDYDYTPIIPFRFITRKLTEPEQGLAAHLG